MVCGQQPPACRAPVHDVPARRLIWVERRDTVEHVSMINNGGAAVSEVRVPDAEKDGVLREEDGVQICGRCLDGGKNVGLAGRGVGLPDAVCAAPPGFEVVVEDIAGYGVGFGVCSGNRTL